MGTGDVVAAGGIRTNAGFTVLKFDGATGAERWRQVIMGPAGPGIARAVAVDGHGDVVAAGQSRDHGNAYGGFTVIKLDGASGS